MTTGTLALAPDLRSANALSSQFRTKTVQKEYVALVRGGMETFKNRSGSVNVPLVVSEEGRVKIAGKRKQDDVERQSTSDKEDEVIEARTDWQVLGSSVSKDEKHFLHVA